MNSGSIGFKPESTSSSSQIDESSSAGAQTEIPVGVQTIQVPPSVAAHLKSLSDKSPPQLDATQVWFSHSKGKLVLHLGDVERATVDD